MGSFWDEGVDIIIVNHSFSSDLLEELQNRQNQGRWNDGAKK